MNVEFPEKLYPIFEPSRYKVLYGGRGGSKSWGVARGLLIQAAQNPLRILCAREFQSSIKDSVHKLLSDQINELGLSDFYEVQQSSIKGKNGTEFAFEGIRHNIVKIKSFEGCDICWVEEAQTVSKTSWDILIPTIRKENSEIWLTFNPELEEDETYQRFVVNPPENTTLIKINWNDNPWFPEVLRQEKDYLKEKDPDAYLNVWEGHCKQALDGAIYANELRAAQENGQLTRVPYDSKYPVHTFWDLGWADNTSIWFAQPVGMEYRIIDFYENSQQPIQHYISKLNEKNYVYDTDHLPHDAKAKQLGTGRSIEEILKSHNRKVSIVPKLSINDGINAVKSIFSQCFFDETKCADGISALRHYKYDISESGQFSKNPLHDWSSHASDAFRYLAVGIKQPRKKQQKLNYKLKYIA